MMATIPVNGKRDLLRLRRHALHAQGLNKNAHFGSGLNGALQAVQHLGYVQIDTISVVERAHHHVLRSRVPNFQPTLLDRLLARAAVFEYWAHAAAFLPMQDFRFSLPYKAAMRSGDSHWVRSTDSKLMSQLLQRIRSDGPLRARDIEDNRDRRAGWWDWKPAKKALEQLFMQGDLMVSARDGFEKSYDLTERVLPSGIDTRMPDVGEFARHLLEQQLRCHALVSQKGITYLRRSAELRKAVKSLLEEQLAGKELDTLVLADGTRFYARAGLLDEPLPRGNGALRILSPFDNAVIQRDRLNALFAFDYQIECYVPEAKRRYGYFCLPLLYRDHFVGQIDCKAHRQQGFLELKAVHLHDHPFAEHELADALAMALPEFQQFQGCDDLRIASAATARASRDFQRRLSAVTASTGQR